jgi:hypothetical protein
MLSDEEIDQAKLRTDYNLELRLRQHADCIRIAYEWLDAQIKTKNGSRRTYALKHLVEDWAGRYISQSDVSVAAELHPDMFGKYPHFNIGARLVEPSISRLEGIREAFTHCHYREDHDPTNYKIHE